ncbi:MAG: hypothetical protein U0165_09230 [Polyangiaceae bacterium]
MSRLPHSLADLEGREIYRRSVGLLVLEAARSLSSGSRFWIGPSVGAFLIVSHDGASGLSNEVIAEKKYCRCHRVCALRILLSLRRPF